MWEYHNVPLDMTSMQQQQERQQAQQKRQQQQQEEQQAAGTGSKSGGVWASSLAIDGAGGGVPTRRAVGQVVQRRGMSVQTRVAVDALALVLVAGALALGLVYQSRL
jgi:hypothetical protein